MLPALSISSVVFLQPLASLDNPDKPDHVNLRSRGAAKSIPQILEMARRRQRGLIDDAAWRRWEYELCRASKEGRVRGALSLDDGLPVTR